jgi:hypothetical protein
MRIPYLLAVALRPILTKGASFFHYRPVVGVRVAGPKGDFLYQGLLDPGADETCF